MGNSQGAGSSGSNQYSRPIENEDRIIEEKVEAVRTTFEQAYAKNPPKSPADHDKLCGTHFDDIMAIGKEHGRDGEKKVFREYFRQTSVDITNLPMLKPFAMLGASKEVEAGKKGNSKLNLSEKK